MRVTKDQQQAVNEAAWAFALTRPCFGYAEIAANLRIGVDQATRIVQSWVAESALTQLPTSHGQRYLWQIKADFVRRSPTKGRTPEGNMWTAMRMLKSFTPTDLSAHASTDTVQAPLDIAQTYCRTLLAGGYLKVMRKAAPGLREAIYRLTKDTGPRPPREKRVRAVVDDNTGQLVVIGGGQ